MRQVHAKQGGIGTIFASEEGTIIPGLENEIND